MDYYQLLEVDRNVSPDDLKKAYRKLAVKHHPDKNPGNKAAEEKFKQISEAYDTLRDEESRRLYDQLGHDAYVNRGRSRGGGGFHDPFDIFNQVFGRGRGGGGMSSIFEEFFGGGGQQSGSSGGADLRYDLEIDLDEAVLGADKTINFHRLESCQTCQGTGCAQGSTRVKCNRCGGSGYMSSNFGGFLSMRQTCSACQGSGQTVSKPCKDCSGEGRVRRETSIKVRIPPGVDTGARPSCRGRRRGWLQRRRDWRPLRCDSRQAT